MWETNFVPDLARSSCKTWGDRGGGGTNIMFVLADGTMHAHISEMPVGTYKKGHRHGPSFHVMCVDRPGLFAAVVRRREGFPAASTGSTAWCLAPADSMFHQHFNTGAEPARYLATAVGGLRYPTHARASAFRCLAPTATMPAVSMSVKEGGDQIEYEDQDPRIHRIWLEDMRKNG